MKPKILASIVVGIASSLAACSTAPKTDSGKTSLHEQVEATIARFKKKDQGMKQLFAIAFTHVMSARNSASLEGRDVARRRGEWDGIIPMNVD